MESTKLKEYLLQIVQRITPETTLEDIYEQLALLADIDESDKQESDGRIFTQEEVEAKSKEWLK